MHLRTERLVIRGFQASDYPFYVDLVTHPSLGMFDEDFPKSPQSAYADFAEALKIRDLSENVWQEFGIYREMTLIGMLSCRLERLPIGGLSARLGYHLHPDWRGRGLASEAVGAFLAFLEGLKKIIRAECVVDPLNESSIRLLKRLGFETDGVLRPSLGGPEITYWRLF